MWTDASDRYRIEARLVGHDGGTVRLKRADDTVIEIPLDQLSEADRKYVAEYDAGNPFLRGMKQGDAAAIPQPPVPMPVESAAAADPPASNSDDAEPAAIDWASVPSIDVPFGADTPSLRIAPAEQGPALIERTIPLPDLRDLFENAGALIVDGPSGTAAFSASLSQRDQASTTVTTVDLASGSVTKTFEAPGAYRLLAWDADAKRVLMAGDARDPRERRTVEVWSLEADELSKVFVADSSDDARGGSRGMKWGGFLSADRFALLSERGRFSIWSLEANEPVAATSVDGIRAASLSPDRALAALVTNDAILFLDVADSSIVGRLKESLPGAGSVAFSPDGKRLAVAWLGKVRVWKTDDLTQSVELKGGRGRGAFFFADEGRIYAGDRLIDVESGRAIVEIQGAGEVAGAGGGFSWLYAEDKLKRVRKLVALPALPEDALALLDVGPPPPRDVLLAEGTPVRLDVSGIADEAIREAVQKALEEVVKKSGRAIEADAPATLIANVGTGEERTYQYTKVERRGIGRGFGPGPPFGPFVGPRIGPFGDDIKERREIKITPATLSLELKAEEKTLWSQTKSQLPSQLQNQPPIPTISFSFPIPEGKTVDDVVNDIQTPKPERFSEFDLPAEVLAPEVIPPPVLGTRRLTTSGLQ